MRFLLNDLVHQALWRLILDSRSDDRSPYSCYRDYLVDS